MPGLNQIATSADFVWSVPFCVYIDTQDPIVRVAQGNESAAMP
jgi:hypothetical protein